MSSESWDLFAERKQYAVFIQLSPRKRYQIAEFDSLEEAERYVASREDDRLTIARRRPMS